MTIPRTPEELVTRVDKLVSLPEVYFRVNDLLDDPHSSASDIRDVIQHDPGFATRLLKIANSAFYGFPSKIETLSRAITLIGTQDLRDLILGAVAVDTFNRISTELVDMSTFWHHSPRAGDQPAYQSYLVFLHPGPVKLTTLRAFASLLLDEKGR